jgi:hypothetical protein
VAKLLPSLNDNLLVVFPGFGIAENFAEQMQATAEEFGFKIVYTSGSAGKITAQMNGQKSLLITTVSKLMNIDFNAIRFGGALLHRLPFNPPPDPLFAQRLPTGVNEFEQVAMPGATYLLTKLITNLERSSTRFFAICLDAHCSKTHGFAQKILVKLPGQMPIRSFDPQQMPAAIARFVANDE